MGKRSAVVELFLGDMGSIQRELRPSMQREDQLTMETKLEQIAVKARREPNLRFTSLAHHITRDRVLENLSKIPKRSAAGVDGQTVEAAKESFDGWIEPVLQSIHRQGYRAPNIRRVYIPKPGKTEKRPLGVPTVTDRALQRTTAEVLSAIYEQDFLPCSFGGRPELSAHHALATLNEVISGGMIGWVLEADLKNFFGSLNHDWVLRFVEHRVGDPRLISLIRRWLKAGVLEDGAVHPSEQGTPQGGSISVLLSNVYLHYVAGPLVRARCEEAVAGRSPTGTLYRRLCDLLPISLGRHPRTGRLASAVGNVQPYSRADQDQIGRVWSVRAETRGQTRQEPPGNYLLSGPDALLHAEPKRKLQGWDAHREISAKAQPYVSARANAANTTSHNQ